MTEEDMKANFAGKRVQYVGMMGNTDGPIGKVWRVTKHGIWVSFPEGHREQLHPEDIRVV